jgi:hypothetical protein
LYAVALDTKEFDLLYEVFTEDVDTIYPFKGAIKGVTEVAAAIKTRFVKQSAARKRPGLDIANKFAG